MRRKHIAHITGPESYRAARDRVTGLTDVLTEHGLTLAGGAPLYGYDNWEIFAADCRLPLTTVDLDLEQLATTAATHLFAVLDGQTRSGVIRQPCRLVVRESTAPLPSR
ncbi:substrate-binding domain-containing protein [Lentzea flaviverrucosa]|uniref:substrate-binding domain-containing protein n=1 Tax=Lentzea flaviverrucosa TaxID=200379 RepID=UPI0021088426|nr:substrate-binding domain-containing protein [Lentzea flaviverrucosa]